MKGPLLTRDDFRELVFNRDRHLCVHCGKDGVDAHHLLERRLFSDGGYYLGNGVTLCAQCHWDAESTALSVEELRKDAGIEEAILPEHFEDGTVCDKWGNFILPNGYRLQGELFREEPVQKVLQPFLYLFVDRVRYPKTFHTPWSPGLQNDDRVIKSMEQFNGLEVVITEKMDGENTTISSQYIHARSPDSKSAPWRDRIKPIWDRVKHDIPQGWRLCGENMSAVHSIRYESLPSFFLLFSVWNEANVALSWDETEEWASLLGVSTVPVLYRGIWNEEVCHNLENSLDVAKQEGLVIRSAASVPYRDFSKLFAKWVRKGHVTTSSHWTKQKVVYNKLANTEL